MRYREIIEAETVAAKQAKSVWAATQKKHRAARQYQTAVRKAQKATATAKSSQPEAERAKRVNAAGDRQTGAKDQYSQTMKSADDSIRSALAR